MLGITKADFAIRAENFNLLQPWNILRIFAGFCMLPHAASKFANGGLSAGTVGFFAKAGFSPAEFFVAMAATSEITIGIALMLGICTRFAALGGAAVLGLAIYAIQTVKGFGWLWNLGGHEYNVFWALVLISIAMNEFQRLAVTKK
jgi:putative oxidoreductase